MLFTVIEKLTSGVNQELYTTIIWHHQTFSKDERPREHYLTHFDQSSHICLGCILLVGNTSHLSPPNDRKTLVSTNMSSEHSSPTLRVYSTKHCTPAERTSLHWQCHSSSSGCKKKPLAELLQSDSIFSWFRAQLEHQLPQQPPMSWFLDLGRN